MGILLLAALLAQSADLLTQGNQALDAKQYDRAIELFTRAAQADPKDDAVQFQLALTYSLLGRDTDAIPHYKSALELNPGLYEVELNLGLSLLRTHAAAEAIPFLKTATAQRPKEYRPAFYLGQALFETSDYAGAETAYKKAVENNSLSGAAESGLGMSIAKQGRLDEAAPHFKQAFTVDRTYRSAYVTLGQMYESAHRIPEAIAIYREFPDNPLAQERLGVLLTASGKLSEAIPALEEAAAKNPTRTNRIELAQAYVKNKQLDKAQGIAEQALSTDPKDAEMRMFYAKLLRDQRKYSDAAQQFVAVTQLDPDSPDAWGELASIYVTTEQYSQAIAALDHIKTLGKEGVGNFFYRALAYDHLRRWPDAIENYKTFLAGSQGKYPDQEFQARQRVRILETELKKR